MEHAIFGNPVALTLSMDAAPNLLGTSTLRAVVASNWIDLGGLTLTIDTSPGLEVTSERTITLDIARGEALAASYELRPVESGEHDVTVVARWAGDGAVFEASEHATLYAPATGLGWFSTASDGAPSGPLPEVLPVEATGEQPASAPASAPGDVATITSCLHFIDHTDASLLTNDQRWLTINVYDMDGTEVDVFGSETDDDLLATGETGTDGCFSFDVPTDDPDGIDGGSTDQHDIYFCWVFENSRTKLHVGGDAIAVCLTGSTELTGPGPLDFGDLFPPAGFGAALSRVFQYVNNGWDYAVNHAGIPSGTLGVHPVVFTGSGCLFYTRSDDTQHVCYIDGDVSSSSDKDMFHKSPDDILHEYGHFVHDKLYGDSFWPSPGGMHFLCEDNQNRGLAWTEGFGNFFGPRANNEVSAPGANGDVFYSRPADGSVFSLSMETRICPTSIEGDDDELNVAQALWDLRDAEADGFDTAPSFASFQASFIFGKVSACDDASYHDFYNGGGADVIGVSRSTTCNWTSSSGPGVGDACGFVTTAFNNRIDLNELATSTITGFDTPGAVVSGTIAIGGTAIDPEDCDVSFDVWVSSDASCSEADSHVASDADGSDGFSVELDTTTLPDGTEWWVCVRGLDPLEDGAFVVSSGSFVVDNTPVPVPELSVLALTSLGLIGIGALAARRRMR